MAKTTGAVAATEHKIEEFAEDLGKMLGQARSKAEGWLGQRQQIVKNLTQLRDEATKLLADLGHEAAGAGRRGRKAMTRAIGRVKRGPGRPAGSKSAAVGTTGAKKKRTMSAEARAAISAAQKKRWAKQKAAEKK
jgi:hypothetical protein